MSPPRFALPCRIRYTRRQGSIAIRITADEIRLLAPRGTPDHTLNQLLRERADWINRAIGEHQASQPPPRTWQDGDSLRLEGSDYPLRLTAGSEDSLSFDGHRFCLRLRSTDTEPAQRLALIQDWYQQQAEVRWPERLVYWSGVTGLQPQSLKIRPYKSRWGACTRDGRISLNTLLLPAPREVLDYVIIHELCHLMHLNHSPAFWGLVESHCPEWKLRRRWLRDHGHRLALS